MSNVLKEKVDPHSHINCCYAPPKYFHQLLTYIGRVIIYLQVLLDLCIPAHICEVQGCHFFEDIFSGQEDLLRLVVYCRIGKEVEICD